MALFAVPGGGKLDGQIKMAKSFGLMRPPFDSTRLEICALPDEVAGEIKPAAIRLACRRAYYGAYGAVVSSAGWTCKGRHHNHGEQCSD